MARRWDGRHFRERVQSLRQQLLATGLSRWPTCGICHQEKFPHDFVETLDGTNVCSECHHGRSATPSLFSQGNVA